MSYLSTGDSARYTLLTNGCWDLEAKAYVDKALCETPVMPAASIGSGFGLPGWLLPVGIGVAAFLFFKSRGGPKQNPARRRRRKPRRNPARRKYHGSVEMLRASRSDSYGVIDGRGGYYGVFRTKKAAEKEVRRLRAAGVEHVFSVSTRWPERM